MTGLKTLLSTLLLNNITTNLQTMSDSIINEQEEAIQVDYEKGNFSFPEDYTYDAGTGLNEETVAYISKVKNEAEWVKEFRLKALEIFNCK